MGLYQRCFASVYDRFMARSEAAGLADLRRAVLAQAEGRALELGAGTGHNLTHYPAAVTEVILTEPSEAMAKRLRRRAAKAPLPARVVVAPAERLPVDDASVDTVVGTLVLCTVDDPERALAEVARVLRPGGRLLFLEHVRSAEPGLARWQDRLERPWHAIGAGCHPNRDTLATIAASPLAVEHAEHGRLPKAMPLVRPAVWGTARSEPAADVEHRPSSPQR